MNESSVTANRERRVEVASGAVMLTLIILVYLATISGFIYSLSVGVRTHGQPNWWLLAGSVFVFVVNAVLTGGFFTLQPNESRVLVLFGAYKGTVRTDGFHWANPFYLGSSGACSKSGARSRISLRARNFNSDKLKVNDKRGNPIEIAAVVVWRVQDTAQALFDVEDFENYVRVQSESAVRHLASGFAYDQGEESEVTLRSGGDEIAQALKQELQERLNKAGVLVEEARLTHLAYAPEIAQSMLRRQQAEAVIAARQKIVQGAVSMVDMALKELAAKQVVQLDDERRAAMVSNLMVVLCSESEVHPVVNTGTLYS
jgi:regulator of protease activity HflC (stomatin/prohibitin superfamily)